MPVTRKIKKEGYDLPLKFREAIRDFLEFELQERGKPSPPVDILQISVSYTTPAPSELCTQHGSHLLREDCTPTCSPKKYSKFEYPGRIKDR